MVVNVAFTEYLCDQRLYWVERTVCAVVCRRRPPDTRFAGEEASSGRFQRGQVSGFQILLLAGFSIPFVSIRQRVFRAVDHTELR